MAEEPVKPTATDFVYEPHPLTTVGYDASAGALEELTRLAENKNQPPTSHSTFTPPSLPPPTNFYSSWLLYNC
jgi:hypothetical protein